MAEPGDADDESEPADDADEPFESAYATERTTAPQSPYTQRDVLVGVAIALVGLLITFAVPLALA